MVYRSYRKSGKSTCLISISPRSVLTHPAKANRKKTSACVSAAGAIAPCCFISALSGVLPSSVTWALQNGPASTASSARCNAFHQSPAARSRPACWVLPGTTSTSMRPACPGDFTIMSSTPFRISLAALRSRSPRGCGPRSSVRSTRRSSRSTANGSTTMRPCRICPINPSSSSMRPTCSRVHCGVSRNSTPATGVWEKSRTPLILSPAWSAPRPHSRRSCLLRGSGTPNRNTRRAAATTCNDRRSRPGPHCPMAACTTTWGSKPSSTTTRPSSAATPAAATKRRRRFREAGFGRATGSPRPSITRFDACANAC